MTIQEFVESINEEQDAFENILVCKPEERDMYIQKVLAYRDIKAMLKRIIKENDGQ